MNEFKETPPRLTAQVARKEEARAEDELRPKTSLPDNISATSPSIERDDASKLIVAEAASSSTDNNAIETIGAKNHTIQIDTHRLKEIKEKYGISDWDVRVDPNFSFIPSKANWKTKTVVVRPFNFWSYLAVGSSVEKRNQVLPRLFAHELKHSQQERTDGSLRGILRSARYGYWFHPAEVDARRWSTENWEEFQGLFRIDRKH